MGKRILALALVGALVGLCVALAEDFNVPKGPCMSAPPAKPQSRSSGEALQPLPLPGTPLRRSERKRRPAPPPLIAKIQFGATEPTEIEHEGGVVRYHDWNKDPGDIPMLLKMANEALDIRYTYKRGTLDAFSPDPSMYPIFYYTGSDSMKLSDPEVKHLREFVQAGGTIWGDTCFGDPEFFGAFVTEMSKLFGDRHFRRLPISHPIFNAYHKIDQVTYTRDVPDAPNGEPVFYGLDLGCRTAIVLSRYDISCGWDGHIREGALGVHPNDARRLGVNMIAYALATHRLAIYQSTAKTYYEKDKRARGDFVFGQVKLGENWDTQHNAIANLLKALAVKTSTEVKFERRTVDLATSDLHKFPFLYITGHYDFKLTDEEINRLKRYLNAGGFLLGSACCGSLEFDTAFRREIVRVLPGAKLKMLADDHAVYTMLHQIDSVEYAPYVASLEETPPTLPMEGIAIGGSTPIIYTAYGIGGGWRGFDHPYGRDIAKAGALKLGVNTILYSMTH